MILQAALQQQASPSPTPEAALSNGQLELGIAVLVVGVVITFVFAAFLGFGLRIFYDTFKATVTPGEVATVALQPTVEPVVQTHGLVGDVAGIVITGPATVEVGSPATFNVTRADGSKVTSTADWRIRPADAATVTSTGDDVAQVKAAKAVAFRVSATVKEDIGGTPTTLVGTANVEAKAKESAAGKALLPFVGKGYITLLVLPLLITVVGLLGITGALNGEALSAFVGAIGGFLFGHAAAAAGSGSGSGSGSKDSAQS